MFLKYFKKKQKKKITDSEGKGDHAAAHDGRKMKGKKKKNTHQSVQKREGIVKYDVKLPNYFLRLPSELLFEKVFPFLEIHDLVRHLSLVSSSIKDLVYDQVTWFVLSRLYFPSDSRSMNKDEFTEEYIAKYLSFGFNMTASGLSYCEKEISNRIYDPLNEGKKIYKIGDDEVTKRRNKVLTECTREELNTWRSSVVKVLWRWDEAVVDKVFSPGRVYFFEIHGSFTVPTIPNAKLGVVGFDVDQPHDKCLEYIKRYQKGTNYLGRDDQSWCYDYGYKCGYHNKKKITSEKNISLKNKDNYFTVILDLKSYFFNFYYNGVKEASYGIKKKQKYYFVINSYNERDEFAVISGRSPTIKHRKIFETYMKDN